jgi:hypothetical protein
MTGGGWKELSNVISDSASGIATPPGIKEIRLCSNYREESFLAIAREDECGYIYRWSWAAKEWVHDVKLTRKIKLGDG